MPNPHADIVSELRAADRPSDIEHMCLKIKRATGGLDVYVRAMDAEATSYMACADRPAFDGIGMVSVATAYGEGRFTALDNLASALGLIADEDGNLAPKRNTTLAVREAA